MVSKCPDEKAVQKLRKGTALENMSAAKWKFGNHESRFGCPYLEKRRSRICKVAIIAWPPKLPRFTAQVRRKLQTRDAGAFRSGLKTF